MKKQLTKWMPILALISFVAAVFMIADGSYWIGVVLIGAGACFSSVAAVWKKESNACDEDQETK